MPGPPPDPRQDRQRALILFLRASGALVLAAAVLTLVLGSEAPTGAAMVGLLIGVPATRVAWLGIRWARRGDALYATITGALLAVLALAGATSL